MGADGLAELGLGQEQEVVLAATPDEERRDHAPFRRQDQRLARLARENVVGDDPLQQVGGVGPLHADDARGRMYAFVATDPTGLV